LCGGRRPFAGEGHGKKRCRFGSRCNRLELLKGVEMALISDVAAIGTAIVVVIFSVWMVKQVFSDQN